jgi:hypothetical protein
MFVLKKSAFTAEDVPIEESEHHLGLATMPMQHASGPNTTWVRAVGAAFSGALMRVVFAARCVAEAEGFGRQHKADTIKVRSKPLAHCWRRLAGVTIPRAKLLRHCL